MNNNKKIGLLVLPLLCGLWFGASYASVQAELDPVAEIDNSPDDVIPPANIRGFKAAGLDSQIVLTWINPSDADFVRTVIIRKAGSAPSGRTDGTPVYEGELTAFTDTNLANGTTYYYSAYAFDHVPNYSSGISVFATTQAGKTQIDYTNSQDNYQQTEDDSSETTITIPKLINHNGTFYLIKNGQRHGIANPGLLTSLGLTFAMAKPATNADLVVPEGEVLAPSDGILAKASGDPTVYLISNSQRHGFVDAGVFTSLDFSFRHVLVITAPELNKLPVGSNVDNSSSAHLPGLDVNDNGTIYWIGYDGYRHPYPSLAVYNSWRVPNDFTMVLKANTADKALPEGDIVTERIMVRN